MGDFHYDWCISCWINVLALGTDPIADYPHGLVVAHYHAHGGLSLLASLLADDAFADAAWCWKRWYQCALLAIQDCLPCAPLLRYG